MFLFVSAASLYTLGDAATLIVGELLILAVPLAYLLFRRIDIKSYVRIDLNPKFILIGLHAVESFLLLNVAVSNALTAIFGVSQTVENQTP